MSCVEDSATVDLDIDGGVLTADVVVSPVENNLLAAGTDGLYVPPEVPAGVVLPYVGAAAPSGWLLADGSAVSRSTYADLFALVGEAFGAGDGSTTFNLPDMRGRAPFGLGTHADVNALGDSDGDAVGDRRPAHAHTFSLSIPNGNVANPGTFAHQDNNGPQNFVPVSGSIGPTSNRNVDAPSYLVLNFIIKT